MHENIHSLTISKGEGFFLKLDLSKAYDRVDWNFFKRGSEAFGFNKRFLELVLMLVSSATFSVLVNGSPTPFFWASHGLRQGDLLSPILFILMAECLGRFVEKMVSVVLRPSSKDLTCSINNLWMTLLLW